MVIATEGRIAAAAGPARPIVPDDWKALHDRWAEAVTAMKIPAVSLCVVHKGQIVVLDAFGSRDPRSQAPATVESPFYIASSTKSFTAMAISILADEGKLALDDPVKKHLPRFELGDAKTTESMTIRDLLSHGKGIDSGPISSCEAYTGLIDDDRYYRLLKRVRPTYRFRYSNLNFTLAGRVIEAVSGKHWKQFITERILQPAGMHHSYCQASQLYADLGAALPVTEVNGELVVPKTVKVDTTMHAAGGMGASATDLGRWLLLNLNAGTIDGTSIVSAERAREMQTLQVKSTRSIEPDNPFRDEGYGLGWFVGKYRDRPIVWHFGGYVGARCHISFMPAESLGVAVLINCSGPQSMLADVVAADAYDKLLALEPIDLLPKVTQIVERARSRVPSRPPLADSPPLAGRGLSRPIDEYAGRYFHEDVGTLDVEATERGLAAKLGAHTPTLESIADDEFRSNLIPGDVYKCKFELDDQGRVVALVANSTLSKVRFQRQ